jgi:hypothetical protein
MSKSSPIVMLALALLLPAAEAPTHLVTAPALIAANRCNSQTIDGEAARLGDYEHNAPSGTPSALLARYGELVDVIATLGEERGILNSICTTDAQRAPLFTQIAATAAWALALEADVAARLNVSCPAAAKALPTMMLADAWLSLANVVNEQGGTAPPAFDDVIPKVQTRAAAVGLVLPSWSATSQYWRDQVSGKAKAELATCPSPAPAPSPTG